MTLPIGFAGILVIIKPIASLNISSRDQKETFTYDGLNRLISYAMTGGATRTVTYTALVSRPLSFYCWGVGFQGIFRADGPENCLVER